MTSTAFGMSSYPVPVFTFRFWYSFCGPGAIITPVVVSEPPVLVMDHAEVALGDLAHRKGPVVDGPADHGRSCAGAGR